MQASTHESKPRRGRPRKSVEVKAESSDGESDVMNPSEGLSSDEEPLATRRSSKVKTLKAKKVLRAVAVPSTTPATSTGARRRVPSSQTPSSISSLLSTTRDHSIDYETPGTSAVATPAETSAKNNISSKPMVPPSAFSKTSNGLRSGKRKREAVPDTFDDARLAQALQAQEYEDVQEKSVKRRRPAKIEDSDDDDDSILSDPLVEDDSSVNEQGSDARKSRPAKRITLPSRSARESAKKTISVDASLGIGNSEDDLSISEFSELDSDEFDESDDDDVDKTVDDVPAPPLDAAVTGTDQVGPSHRRRRRGPRVAAAAAAAARFENLRRRRQECLNWRVSKV